MSDLTTGSSLSDWSHPSPVYINGEYVTGGMVWMGKELVTLDDIQLLKKEMGDNVKVDRGSLVGLYHWAWTSLFTRYSSGQPAGGVGSEPYELQHVGEGQGAQFTKEPIWYTTCSGELVKGVPPEAGCYHMVSVGGGYMDAVEGPEEGSPADGVRGGGTFYWDNERKLYDVK